MARFEELTAALYTSLDRPDFVSLFPGLPGQDTLKPCGALMLEASNHLLQENTDEERYIFQYGPLKGDPTFREELAKFLSREYGDTVDSESLMVTAGATQGLHLVATVMFDKDTPVFVEDPTYFIAIKILREDYGMNVIPVPSDADGMDVNSLEKLLVQHKPKSTQNLKSPFWSMVYTVPTFNNPRGFCMSPGRCKALIQLARKHDVMLFAEDVYNLLHYAGAPHPPHRLLHYDQSTDEDYKGGNVLSNATFSKILAPGLRLGWIEAPPRILTKLAKCSTTWSGGAFNHYTSRLVATALKEGLLNTHITNLRKIYGERMDFLCRKLKEKLPASVKLQNPKGGFFLWLEFPEGMDTEKMLRMAIDKHKVNFIHGVSTSPTASFRNCARLSISYCDQDTLELGAQRFCQAAMEMLQTL